VFEINGKIISTIVANVGIGILAITIAVTAIVALATA
jgi:hypothetical protein